MEHSASRHLRRRQLTLKHIVTDLTHITYTRAYQIGKVRTLPDRDKISVTMADLDRQDNQDLAAAAKTVAASLATLTRTLPRTRSQTLRHRLVSMIFRFAGEPLDEREIDAILAEVEEEEI
jgi:hypothetical protein